MHTKQCVAMVISCWLACAVAQQHAAGRRHVTLLLPRLARQGDTITMRCRLSSSQRGKHPLARIYSVQWYKEGREFYRYTPADKQRHQAFPVDGINIDMTTSDERSVTLRNIQQNTSGQFRCEISLEAPSFDTYYDYGDLIVIVSPSEGPTVEGARHEYREGDMIDLNCTQAGSKPAAALNWYINGKKAEPSQLIERAPVRGNTGLETSSLGLRMTATIEASNTTPARPAGGAASGGGSGTIRVNCTAAVADVFWSSRQLKLLVVSPQQLSALHSSRAGAIATVWSTVLALLSAVLANMFKHVAISTHLVNSV